jgi:hypothetical protein
MINLYTIYGKNLTYHFIHTMYIIAARNGYGHSPRPICVCITDMSFIDMNLEFVPGKGFTEVMFNSSLCLFIR